MTTDEAIQQRQQAYWYRIYIGECPMCGADKGGRERVYGPRPEKREDRYMFLADSQCYDGCIG